MSELTFKIEYLPFAPKELEDYIKALKGIKEMKTNLDTDEIYIKYEPKLISIKIIVMEIKLFLSLTNTPSIIAFNKYSEKEIVRTTLDIGDGCCEYCLKGFIEDLILINGIEEATADYENCDFFNVSVEVSYDKSIFNDITIKELVVKYYN